ncbi:malonate--CoA ligase [Pseudogemmobacter humi]|uniref:Long-chain-fatty-acid--CoA ligase n=1 Tax=Pseudogemmobacter humi TaxID=2483812 RepID=A0A3P5XCS3_9RHOB|nr:malonyl-CoA synthase [Pseudogemmobacter humi]VDC28030.1 Long-chain-fatty-acid--CoA ligase [Pseudogemmobacter humi]
MTNLVEAFDLAGRAGRPVLIPFAGGVGQTAVTCGDLRALAARFAGVLDELGLVPGDRVVVRVEKTVANLALYLATLQRGAVFVPLNTAYRPQEVEYFLRDTSARLVVCDPADAEVIRPVADETGARVLTLDAFGEGSLTRAAGNPQPAIVARDDDDIAAILYTSGTTGKPKGAMLSHGNLRSNAMALRDLWQVTGDDVMLHALPVFHAHGLFVGCNVMLLAGAQMLFLPKFDLSLVLDLLPRATVMMGIPTFYTRLLADPRLDREKVRGMRLFTCGSAPLLAETHREWSARTGTAILERYGMTETGMNTSNPYEGERRPGSVGPALPGVSVRVTRPGSAEVLPPGEIGMIEVKGPNVFRGYWGLPEKTAAEFHPGGWFITGDLGFIQEDGYVQIVGRGKDLVITGGFNVYPKEVETEIDALEGVAESAVIGLPHADFGEAVTAVVVAQPGAAISEAAIQAALRERLAAFKLPKKVIFLPELPRNTMGKVQKAQLREIYRGLYSA